MATLRSSVVRLLICHATEAMAAEDLVGVSQAAGGAYITANVVDDPVSQFPPLLPPVFH